MLRYFTHLGSTIVQNHYIIETLLFLFTKMELTAKSKFTILLCMVLVFTLMSVQGSAADGSTKAGLLFLHRKVFLERKKTGFKIRGMPEFGSYGHGETPEDRELRRVPAGPNPLHHNGRDPTKPRTP